MPEKRVPRTAWQRYGIALLSVVAAYVITQQFFGGLEDYRLLPFVCVVAGAAWFLGLGPAIMTALISALGLHYLSHTRQLVPLDWHDLADFAPLLLTATLIVYLNSRRLKAENQSAGLRSELATATNELAIQRSDMARLQEFSVRISSGLDLGPLLNEVLTAITSLQLTGMGLVLLYDAARNDFYPAVWRGFSEEQIQHFWQAPAMVESLSGRKPVMIEDVEASAPSLVEIAQAAGFRSVHSTPVLTRSHELLGSLILFFTEPRHPSEREVRLVELYARQASNAIENARLYGQSVESMRTEQRRTSLLRSLAQAALRINSALNLDALLQAITDEAREIVGANQAFTSLAPGGDWSRMINCVALSEKYAGRTAEFSGGAPEMLFLAGRLQHAVRSSDQANLPNWNVLTGASMPQFPSWLAAPLRTGDGRNFGLIQVVEKVDGEFTEEDQSALTQLAQMATVAVENVRLYREAQEQIRERGRTQEALERSKEALDLTHQAAGIGVWEWNLQTGDLTWSREISALHGFAPESFDGRYPTWLSSVHPEDRDTVNTAVTRAISEGTGYQVQYRNLRPGGDTHWMEARGQVYYAAGRPLRMLGVAMDITVRKQAEEALRASEKLAATGRLAASIAHEINNPLASVTNILYLLNKNLSLDNDARRFVALAESELGRVTHITRQTLAFYRESTRPVPVSLAQVLDEVLGLYNRNISERLITVERKYEFTEGMYGFAGELRQVISNLLLNAIEASPVESTIRIHLYHSPSLSAEQEDGVRLVIADNGQGIAPGVRSRIFEPFFSTKGEKGTGLGLWVSQGIVQKHGGHIRVRSSVNPQQSGTVFSVFLPINHFAMEPSAGEQMEAVA